MFVGGISQKAETRQGQPIELNEARREEGQGGGGSPPTFASEQQVSTVLGKCGSVWVVRKFLPTSNSER
ncbi:hypothetical protein HNY73_017508 [Argiope bruennichi]|uniref:Uncharacterized protein n=1 Tax=Argiope bruennichi TaxID=94029 RepID=A0A8T0EA59_ARGBR|nr:hypothetical protein HNY73_017508 [Argiope bruennichi]